MGGSKFAISRRPPLTASSQSNPTLGFSSLYHVISLLAQLVLHDWHADLVGPRVNFGHGLRFQAGI